MKINVKMFFAQVNDLSMKWGYLPMNALSSYLHLFKPSVLDSSPGLINNAISK
jgi:hypothetical protein